MILWVWKPLEYGGNVACVSANNTGKRREGLVVYVWKGFKVLLVVCENMVRRTC